MLKVNIKGKLLVCISIIFVLSGCATAGNPQEVKSVEEHITLIHFEDDPSSSQSLKVVHAYEGVADYAEAAQDATREEIPDLYKEHVANPFRDECTLDETDEEMRDPFDQTPTRNFDYLIDGANEIRESGIEQIMQEAWEASSKLLPSPETTFCVFVIHPGQLMVKDRMGGVTGFALGPSKVWILIYPGSEWQNNLAYLVAHEYHHSVWFTRHHEGSFADLDLLDRMIIEGKADTFAEIVYPDVKAPWAYALTDKQMAYQWGRIQDNLDATDDLTTNRWIFGQRGVSTWTGYTLGFNMVQGYLDNHPEMSIDEWTAVEAEELLAKSGFNPK